MRSIIGLVLVVTTAFIVKTECSIDFDKDDLWPTVGISVLVRNKAFSLPYFFSCLERLDYPKDRLYISIWSDHNQDNSNEIINTWVAVNRHKFNYIYVNHNDSTGPNYDDEQSATQWTTSRFRNIIRLRENAISVARKRWADYHLMLDADVYLTNESVLKLLVQKELTAVAPVLQSDGTYSNFWAAMSNEKYYKNSKNYNIIRNSEKFGCFIVPMIHSAVLINMNHVKSARLTYNENKLYKYNGPIDDIIIFASSASAEGIPLMVCNDAEKIGYIQVPLEAGDDIRRDYEQLINIKLLALADSNELALSPLMSRFVSYPEPTKLGMDEIYVINLERRFMRREYMEKCFKELGVQYKLFKAVDGSEFNLRNLSFNINLMPGYEDPYHKRPMKTGEIGCFMSHYKIWEEVAELGYQQVMVFEDDPYFRPYFRDNMDRLLKDLQNVEWDLVYLGRKILMESEEVYASSFTVKPRYSYWTIGYILSGVGARKLLAARPLDNMLPVDEFLPIMFDQHPNDTWKSFFPTRNIVALSAQPLLIEPMLYVNQPGYVSDTEDSVTMTSTMQHPPKVGFRIRDALKEELIEQYRGDPNKPIVSVRATDEF